MKLSKYLLVVLLVTLFSIGGVFVSQNAVADSIDEYVGTMIEINGYISDHDGYEENIDKVRYEIEDISDNDWEDIISSNIFNKFEELHGLNNGEMDTEIITLTKKIAIIGYSNSTEIETYARQAQSYYEDNFLNNVDISITMTADEIFAFLDGCLDEILTDDTINDMLESALTGGDVDDVIFDKAQEVADDLNYEGKLGENFGITVNDAIGIKTRLGSYLDANVTGDGYTDAKVALYQGMLDYIAAQDSSDDGSSPSGGSTTPDEEEIEEPTDPTQEAEDTTNEAEEVVNDPNATEDEKTEVTEDAAEKVQEAGDSVENEEQAEQVTQTASKVTEQISKVAQEATTSEAKEKLADSAADTLETLAKVSDKIESSEKAINAAKTQATAIKNIKTVVETADNGDSAKKVVDKISEVLDSTAKLMEKVDNEVEASNIAEDVIASVAELTNAAQTNQTVSESVKKSIKQVQEKAVKVAEKAVEKAGKLQLTEDKVEVEGTKTKASLNSDDVQEKMTSVVNKAQEFENILKENNIEVKKVEKKVSVEVPAAEGSNEVEANIDPTVMDAVEQNGIDKFEVKSQVADFGITSKTFGEEAKGKDISLGAKSVDRNELPENAKGQVPEDSPVVDLDAKIGGEKHSKFDEPIEVSIPYTLKEGQDPKEVTVFLVKDDGSVEPVGGKYDPVTGKVKFTTSHFSKYFAKTYAKAFEDMGKYTWAQKSVNVLAGKGVINGRTENMFDPSADITRAEFAALLARMLTLETEDTSLPFTDVSNDKWYMEELAAAYNNGFIKGKSESEFVPDGNITRQEMAVMITRVLIQKGYNAADLSELDIFADKGNVADWAYDTVATAVKHGIVNGMADGIFAPNKNANRAQAAVMLYRLYFK